MKRTNHDQTFDETGTVIYEETVEFDTDAGTYTVTVDGVVTETRPLTAAESTTFNTTQMVAEQDESVDKLVAVVEALNRLTSMTNADINANPAAVIKDLARECKTIARVANREARFTSGRTESTDTGEIIDT